MVGEIGLKQAVEEYREIYLAYRNFAQRTRTEYVNDLEDLVSFLERMGVRRAIDVTLPHLVRYMAELDKRGYAGSTRKRKVISIRSFFSFLHMEGHILSDIGKRLIPPRIEERKPRYLTNEEISRLLHAARENKRDNAIIQLLLNTGIKLSELTGLRLSDLRKTEELDKNGNEVSYIWVTGNPRGKGRSIPLNFEVSLAISGYFSARGNNNSEYLLINKSGEQLGKRGVEKVIKKYFKTAGIENASVNALRHTFGIHHTVKGTSMETLKEVMGHKDVRSTSHYVTWAKEIVRREMQENSL